MKKLINRDHSPARSLTSVFLLSLLLIGITACSNVTDYSSETVDTPAETEMGSEATEDMTGDCADVSADMSDCAPPPPPEPRKPESGDPLYVLNGTVVESVSSESPLSKISPKDITQIEVLKDAAAVAIYGKAAENGVVKITTRE